MKATIYFMTTATEVIFGRPLTTDEKVLVENGLGPPRRYLKATTGKLSVAGTIFTASSAKKYNDKGMPGAAFMAVRSADCEITYFGVIREVLQVPLPGNSSDMDTLVRVEWFKSSATDKSPTVMHPDLDVPVVKMGFYTTREIGVGNLWSASNIVPIHLTLMPNLGGRAAASELVVLSRDARLLELAHPTWGPNGHLGCGLDGERFKVLRRTALGLQSADVEDEGADRNGDGVEGEGLESEDSYDY